MKRTPTSRACAPTVALVGNPNVGKSTVFNALTHLRQHTGNWSGKTVALAQGSYTHDAVTYSLIDLPGVYSLHPHSAEEIVTRDYLASGEADVVLVVADATCLARSLSLVLHVMEVTWPVVVCVNLMDEGRKKGLVPDLAQLEKTLGCPVVGTSARSGEGLDTLRSAVARAVAAPPPPPAPPLCVTCGGTEDCRGAARLARAEAIAAACGGAPSATACRRDRRWDRFLMSGGTGLVSILLLFGGILWLTVAGANLPSRWLNTALFSLQEPLRALLHTLCVPPRLTGMLVDGLYRTVAWVVSVMLPPMAIFFPLFTLLEDIGYLPRIAFLLDRLFARSGAHGRQGLTMCMGLGCNACGVTGCRIIHSPRERLIAILTNAFTPCNGRFPTLIALISMYFCADGGPLPGLRAAAGLLLCLVLSTGMTLLASRLLSATVLQGQPSQFSLELPPYRMPRIGQVLIRSVFDRTLFTLGRAVCVAAPMGILIWCAANTFWGDTTVLAALAAFLEPCGRLLGMDGVLLLAFFLALPANEIMLPCALMGYLSAASLADYGNLADLRLLLDAAGWTTATALCVLLFTLFHFPCGTTVLTIWRETKSLRWTLLAVLLPTAVGAALCILVTLAAGIL